MKLRISILSALTIAFPAISNASCSDNSDLLNLEQKHTAIFLGVDTDTDLESVLTCFATAPRHKNRKLTISLERIEDSDSTAKINRTKALIARLADITPATEIVFHDGGIGPYTHAARIEALAPWGHTGQQLLAIAREESIARSISHQLSENVFLIAINAAQHVSRDPDISPNIKTAGALLPDTIKTVDLTKKTSQRTLVKTQDAATFDYTYSRTLE